MKNEPFFYKRNEKIRLISEKLKLRSAPSVKSAARFPLSSNSAETYDKKHHNFKRVPNYLSHFITIIIFWYSVPSLLRARLGRARPGVVGRSKKHDGMLPAIYARTKRRRQRGTRVPTALVCPPQSIWGNIIIYKIKAFVYKIQLRVKNNEWMCW